jgi:hypothetical protein
VARPLSASYSSLIPYTRVTRSAVGSTALANGPHCAGSSRSHWWKVTFSVWMQFTVPAGERSATREECHWSHACKSVKRTGVGSNGILECKFLSENADRTRSSTAGCSFCSSLVYAAMDGPHSST